MGHDSYNNQFFCYQEPCLCLCQKKYIHAGKLIDGITDIPIEMITIVINGDIVQSVLRGYLNPGPNDTLINLREYTVLPGLMDMHTHLYGESHPKRYMERFTMDLDN